MIKKIAVKYRRVAKGYKSTILLIKKGSSLNEELEEMWTGFIDIVNRNPPPSGKNEKN